MIYDLHLNYTVKDKNVNKSLISFLCTKFNYKPKHYWLDCIFNSTIKVNNKPPESPNQILKYADTIKFTVKNFYEPDLNTNYKKIWENNHLIVVNKPAGLPVHSNKRFYKQTLTNLLRQAENTMSLNPIHRLDRETSGLMIYAKTKYAHKRIQKNFKTFLCGKFYICLINKISSLEDFVIKLPLKEAKKPPVNYKMIPDLQSDNAKSAITNFYPIATRNGLTLLLAKLNTGRKHQIRAHLAYANMPIIGDKLYSCNSKYFIKRCNDNLTEADIIELGAHNHLLHAVALQLKLPDLNEKRLFLSFDISDEFASYLNDFSNYQSKIKQKIMSLLT